MKLARQKGLVMAGSRQSKNGVEVQVALKLIAAHIGEIRSRLSDSARLYIAGFSGGAKLALYAGTQISDFQGVVYCGAAIQPTEMQKPVFGFTGTSDMNYADVWNFHQSIAGKSPGMLWETKEGHVWPAPSEFAMAMEWIAIREKHNPLDYNQFEKMCLKKAEGSDVAEKIQRLKLLEFVSITSGYPFLQRANLEKELASPSFVAIQSARTTELQNELKLKSLYSNAFFEKDISWWEGEIRELRKSINKPMIARLLGFFSLAGYTLTSQALASGNLEVASKTVQIYKLADPPNPEPAYLSAILAASMHKPEMALHFIEESIELGFANSERMQAEVAFQSMHSLPQFQKLVQQAGATRNRPTHEK